MRACLYVFITILLATLSLASQDGGLAYLESFRKRQREDRIPADIFPEDIIRPQSVR
ncbi:MAG TPA: hypothetical protein VLD57_00055 [Blastocatellia bacterium]|nr:hypothetical protein [Blastocatellia bacterium]